MVKKPFIFIAKADFSINTQDFLKKITDPKLIKDNEEKYGYVTAMLTHGNSDMIGII